MREAANGRREPRPIRCRFCPFMVEAVELKDGLRFVRDDHARMAILRQHVGRVHQQEWRAIQTALDAPSRLQPTHIFHQRKRKRFARD